MGEERKKTHVWHWAAALLIGLPVLYIASFGPACWIVSRTNRGALPLAVVYHTIAEAMWWSPESALASALDRYSRLGAAPDWTWMRVDLSSGETAFIWVCHHR